MDVTNLDSLRQVFVDRVIPLLQEYFYGAWDKICTVLGSPYDDSGAPRRREPHLLDPSGKAYAWPIVRARAFPEMQTLGFDHDDLEDRIDYELCSGFHRGSLSAGDLTMTFLGVLSLDGKAHSERLAVLSSKPEDAATPSGAEV
jgi:hypothetical protein